MASNIVLDRAGIAERSGVRLTMSTLISVCICTLHRQSLEQTLDSIKRQVLCDDASAEIVIIDNDAAGSAESIVNRMERDIPYPVRYEIEPRRGLSFARNCALESARGDWLALIDDDEVAESNWVVELLNCARRYSADAVVGRVWPRFQAQPPPWIARSPVFEYRLPPTGTKVGEEALTGNVLLRAEFLATSGIRFDPAFNEIGSEDSEFFQRALTFGAVIVSAREAVVYELVPPERTTSSYQVQRSLSVGETNARVKHQYGGTVSLLALMARAGVNVLVATSLMLACWPWSKTYSYRYFIFLVRNVGKFRYFLRRPPVKMYS
jgi:succinoglycan biosynthesis protein ExoM